MLCSFLTGQRTLGVSNQIWFLISESPTTVYSMGLHPPFATYCVILGKLLNLSVLRFPPL